jgi:hypothetical protein
MRWTLVCAWMLGCAHAPIQSIAPVERHAPAAKTVSFRERTGPRHPVKDVSHVEVSVHRVEGPESIILGFATIDRLATECWREAEELVTYPTDHDATVTMTIDTRSDGTMAEVELDPGTTPKPIVMCLLHALAAQPLHVEHGPQHLVLTIDARVWWTS